MVGNATKAHNEPKKEKQEHTFREVDTDAWKLVEVTPPPKKELAAGDLV